MGRKQFQEVVHEASQHRATNESHPGGVERKQMARLDVLQVWVDVRLSSSSNSLSCLLTAGCVAPSLEVAAVRFRSFCATAARNRSCWSFTALL
jgi:hypothetical protein